MFVYVLEVGIKTRGKFYFCAWDLRKKLVISLVIYNLMVGLNCGAKEWVRLNSVIDTYILRYNLTKK